MKDDFPGSLASVGAHRQGNHGSCVEVHDETTIVVRNLTTCSRRLLRSQLRHDWNLPTRTERYHAAVEVGPNSPFYPTPMVRRRDGVKAERPGVVETATSHFPTPPPPPPRPPRPSREPPLVGWGLSGCHPRNLVGFIGQPAPTAMASTASGASSSCDRGIGFQQVSSVARRRGGAASQLAISNVARVDVLC